MNLNEPRSKFVTDNTRVTTCKSNAGLREVLELSKRLNSGPKHADVPEDAWFFKANSSDDLMPYSILMEIGLQTSGILTSWVKAPLTMDKDDILFRNLDATAELLKKVDLRGKTITNTSHVVSYAMLGDMGVHKFTFELSVEGEGVFYKGETSFGWFVPEVFEKQG